MLREFLKNWSPWVERARTVTQSGALPYTVVDGRLAVLLVTSRRTGKWIFPKGTIEPDMTPWDSAAKEALEEAGVIGTIETTAIGSYPATSRAHDAAPITIDIYPLRVTSQLDHYKEKGQRFRHWTSVREARRLLGDPALSKLAARLEDHVIVRSRQ